MTLGAEFVDALLEARLGPAHGLPLDRATLALAVPEVPDEALWAAASSVGVVLSDQDLDEVRARLTSAATQLEENIDLAGAIGPTDIDLSWLPASSGLHLGPGITTLGPWLAPLACDVARLEPSGRLAVVVIDPGPRCRGWFRRGDEVSVIAVDRYEATREHHLEHVVAHELAHAIDPLMADVERQSLEAFACHLGPRFLWGEPRQSVADCAELILATRLAIGPRPLRPPLGDLDELVAWALNGPTLPAPDPVAVDR